MFSLYNFREISLVLYFSFGSLFLINFLFHFTGFLFLFLLNLILPLSNPLYNPILLFITLPFISVPALPFYFPIWSSSSAVLPRGSY